MLEDYEVIDKITADSIEPGDQIIVDGDLIEVNEVADDPTAPLEGVRIIGYSHDAGDIVTYDVYYADYFEVWTV